MAVASNSTLTFNTNATDANMYHPRRRSTRLSERNKEYTINYAPPQIITNPYAYAIRESMKKEDAARSTGACGGKEGVPRSTGACGGKKRSREVDRISRDACEDKERRWEVDEELKIAASCLASLKAGSQCTKESGWPPAKKRQRITACVDTVNNLGCDERLDQQTTLFVATKFLTRWDRVIIRSVLST